VYILAPNDSLKVCDTALVHRTTLSTVSGIFDIHDVAGVSSATVFGLLSFY
jgi:hypothetical protein